MSEDFTITLSPSELEVVRDCMGGSIISYENAAFSHRRKTKANAIWLQETKAKIAEIQTILDRLPPEPEETEE